MPAKWTAADLPPLADRVAIVTGANRGLGLELTRALATAGATVVMACRNVARARAAADSLAGAIVGANIDAMPLDLCDLASVRRFAQGFPQRHDRLDLLFNNAAAIMAPKGRTRDGFETHIGVNHLGHFALTGLLLPRLLSTPGARVINSGSLAHRLTPGIDFDDLHLERTPYKAMDAYGRSKLAALMFSFELDRRLRRANASALSVAAHPGYAATNTDLGGFFLRLSTRLFAQPAAMGALPALYAATSTSVNGGDYIGPGGFKELRGYPAKVKARPEAQDVALAARLWQLSEQATGVTFSL